MIIREVIDRQSEEFKVIYDQLNDLGKKTLMILFKNIACEPFDQAKLEKCSLDTLTGAEVMVGLLQLRQKNIIRTMRKTWGDLIHQLPEEHFPVWQSILFGDLILDKPETEVEVTHRFRHDLLLDLFQLLVYIAKHELPLTNKGIIHKRHLLKIVEKLDFTEADFEHLSIHYSNRDIYPASFAVLYDMAIKLDLIELTVDKALLNKGQVHSFFAQSKEMIHRSMYSIWLKNFMPQQVWLQHAIALMVAFAPPGQWVCLNQIREDLKTNAVAMDNLEDEEAMIQFKQQWINPLVAMGWLELGKTGESKEWVRWLIPLNLTNTNQPSQENFENQMVIQPNFEIIAPPTLSIQNRWELECFTEHLKTDQISRYVLTKVSLNRACENGRTIEDIIGYLNQHGTYGIPDNVKLTLLQWSQQFGKVYFMELMLMRCINEEVALEIANHAQCCEFLVSPIGNKDFIVRRKDYAILNGLLIKHGLSPRADIEVEGLEKPSLYPKWGATEDTEPFVWPKEDSKKGILFPRFNSDFYEEVTHLPKIEAMYERLGEIPSIWLKNNREYHGSVRKEIITKAIEWKSYLRISENGRLKTVIPQEIIHNNGTWHVVCLFDGRKTQLTPDDFKSLQLILPGINDGVE